MVAAKGKVLGRGLGALIPGAGDLAGEKGKQNATSLPLSLLQPNINQPRKTWDEEKLQALADSIKTHGVIQPLVVRKIKDGYQIVAGERRWRAAQMAGLNEVPVFFFEGTEKDVQEISLIENIQREDLSPLEVARAIRELLQTFELTQEELAGRIGWSRTLLTNKLRLLQLPERIHQMIENGSITEGHGRALLALETENQMEALALRVMREEMSVRKLEKLIQEIKRTDFIQNKTPYSKISYSSPFMQSMAERHGIKIKVTGNGVKKKLSIDGLTIEQIERLEKLLEDSAASILFPGNKKGELPY